jgi:hypothetical protein
MEVVKVNYAKSSKKFERTAIMLDVLIWFIICYTWTADLSILRTNPFYLLYLSGIN